MTRTIFGKKVFLKKDIRKNIKIFFLRKFSKNIGTTIKKNNKITPNSRI